MDKQTEKVLKLAQKEVKSDVLRKQIDNALNWQFERSSGYPGYRCQKCGTWVYVNQPQICDCIDK